MADYSVTFARSARKELDAIHGKTAQRIMEKISDLAIMPRPPGVKKLHGEDSLWRIRVGDYRVVYEIDDQAHHIDISIIRHRSEVYRDL